MPLLQIPFNNPLNYSIQIGDTAFYSEIDANGIASENILMGTITAITGNIIEVNATASAATALIGTSNNWFFSFSKSITVNESGLKGYYADVTFENASKEYAELFAISSETVMSSK